MEEFGTGFDPAVGAADAGAGIVMTLVQLAVLVVMIASMWKIFVKAGQPGWAAIVPIYNLYVLCEVAGKPGWWVLLMFIPLVNIVVGIILSIALAEKFGQGIGFAIGMILLPIILYPILAFGSAQYEVAAASYPAGVR